MHCVQSGFLELIDNDSFSIMMMLNTPSEKFCTYILKYYVDRKIQIIPLIKLMIQYWLQ